MLGATVAAGVLSVLATTAAAGSGATIRVDVPATTGALQEAQQTVREHIRQRPTADIEVVLQPGVHRLTAPLTFGPEDSGEAGRFHVSWTAAAPNATVFDGGVQIPGPWTADESAPHSVFSHWPHANRLSPPRSLPFPCLCLCLSLSLALSACLSVGSSDLALGGSTGVTVWSAALPPALQEHAASIRQLFVGSTRYFRTRTPAADLGVPKDAALTSDGLRMASLAPELWKNPSTVEIVSDHTWVQHRCPVTSVSKLALPPPPPAPPLHKGTCEWSPKTKGHSPGSSLKRLPGSTYESCQKACCEALPKCEGIIFNSMCYLLDRKYEHGFIPNEGGFVADLNCSSHAPPSCDGVEPPPPQPTLVNISAACFQTATKGGPLALSIGSLAFFENTGNFTAVGQFYIDVEAGKVLVSHSNTPPQNVVMALTQTLMRVEKAHDMTWSGPSHCTFASPTHFFIHT